MCRERMAHRVAGGPLGDGGLADGAPKLALSLTSFTHAAYERDGYAFEVHRFTLDSRQTGGRRLFWVITFPDEFSAAMSFSRRTSRYSSTVSNTMPTFF